MALLDLLKAQKEQSLKKAFPSLVNQISQGRTIPKYQQETIRRYFGDTLVAFIRDSLKEESPEADKIAAFFSYMSPAKSYQDRKENRLEREAKEKRVAEFAESDAELRGFWQKSDEAEERRWIRMTQEEREEEILARGRETERIQRWKIMTQKERDEEDAREYRRM